VGVGDGFGVVRSGVVGAGVARSGVLGAGVAWFGVVGAGVVRFGVVRFGVGVAAADCVGSVSGGREADASGPEDLVGAEADTVGSKVVGRADETGPPPPSQPVRARPMNPAQSTTRSGLATRLAYNSSSLEVVPGSVGDHPGRDLCLAPGTHSPGVTSLLAAGWRREDHNAYPRWRDVEFPLQLGPFGQCVALDAGVTDWPESHQRQSGSLKSFESDWRMSPQETWRR